jgi:hypothetical protein
LQISSFLEGITEVKTESGRERIDGKKKNKKKIEMPLEKPILGKDWDWGKREF